MGWSKQDLIGQAFEAIGIAAYVFDVQSSQFQSAMRQMDAMLAGWNSRGIRMSYSMPSNANGGNVGDASGIADRGYEAVYSNLALRLAPTVGRAVPVELRIIARQAYDALLAHYAIPVEMHMPINTPAGAGQKTWRSTNQPFIQDPDTSLAAGPDSILNFL